MPLVSSAQVLCGDFFMPSAAGWEGLPPSPIIPNNVHQHMDLKNISLPNANEIFKLVKYLLQARILLLNRWAGRNCFMGCFANVFVVNIHVMQMKLKIALGGFWISMSLPV